MKPHKRLLKSAGFHKVMVRLFAAYIRIVYLTGRKTFDIHPGAMAIMRGEENAIFAFWHGRMMLMPCICPPGRLMHVLISLHRDGVFISDVMKEFQFATIAGSTSKNGRAALMAMLKALKNGENVSITPDGPRGPHQTATNGIAVTSKLSGKAILPVTFSSTRHKRFTSWDRFMLTLPFSRIAFCVGAPFVIDKSQPEEEARRAVESAMNELVDRADAALL